MRTRTIAGALAAAALVVTAGVLGAVAVQPSGSPPRDVPAVAPAKAHEAQVPAALAARQPRSPVRLAWFYKPPQREQDSGLVLTRFGTYILSRGDEAFLARLRERRPAVRVLQYFLLTQIIRPPEGGVEQRNNAAYLPGDFERLWREHPDWFLRDQNGQPIVEDGKYYRMDPGNEEWRSFWIERVRAANDGRWDGVFLDNLDLSMAGLERQGFRPPAYPTAADYTATLAGFLARIDREVSEPAGKPLVANLVHPSWESTARSTYLDYLDGAMDEGWAVGWGSGGLSARSWARHLADVDELVRRGKQAILVAQGDRWDLERQAFSFASYLLVAGPRVSFRYTRSGSYGYPWIYDDYRMPLGRPLGPRYSLPDGDLRRDFSNGCVIVDPRSRDVTLDVGRCRADAVAAPPEDP